MKDEPFDSDLGEDDEQFTITPEMAARHRRGLIIGIIGLAGFVPLLVLILISVTVSGLDLNTFLLAVLLLAFWVVWKIGKTIMKLNSLQR